MDEPSRGIFQERLMADAHALDSAAAHHQRGDRASAPFLCVGSIHVGSHSASGHSVPQRFSGRLERSRRLKAG
jgi:hypothetical protein